MFMIHHRPESPTPSCVSMKSDWSKGRPPDFSDEPRPPHTQYVNPFLLDVFPSMAMSPSVHAIYPQLGQWLAGSRACPHTDGPVSHASGALCCSEIPYSLV